MSIEKCTLAPPPPPNASSDWNDVVLGNCFRNIERLGLWKGGQTVLRPRQDPSGFFSAVTPGSLGGGDNPPTIYVVAHGWAPGYRAVVTSQGGDLLWWGKNASASGVWASDWAWLHVLAPLVPSASPVNATGLLQSIVAQDAKAVVLAYSWIDDSATDTGYSDMDEVYASEAYTHINGIRLANALEAAIAPSFWNSHSGLLRLIGHSHGSKVATVAALTLQQRGRRVAHLTIMDAPESEITLEANGANLLGFYLEQMQIANPSYDCAAGAFLDNYVSYFGVNYAGSSNLQNIVEVGLDPSQLYSSDDPGAQHSYAAAWYGGAAAGAASQKEPPLGLAWPPPPTRYTPALNQNWPTGVNQYNQWQLGAGAPISDTFSYQPNPLVVRKVSTSGNVQGDPSTRLLFGPAWPNYSIFHGHYFNSPDSDNYGISFDLVWNAPQVGDYFVVTMESPEEGIEEVLLVMDGQSSPAGKTSVAINCDVSSYVFPLPIHIYFFVGRSNSISHLFISNFGIITVNSASGYLRARRLEIMAEKTRRRALRAPKRLEKTRSELPHSL